MDLNTLLRQAMDDMKTINQVIANNQQWAKEGPYGPATTASIERTLTNARETKERMILHIEKLNKIKQEIWDAKNPEIKQQLMDDAARRATMIAVLVGGAATATAVAGSIFIYKRFFSKAAKACAGRKGILRTNCVSKFKIAGLEQSIRQLKKSRALCGKSSKAATCKAKIDSRINSYQSKIRKQTSKLKENVAVDTQLTECYLSYLYGDESFVENDWRGNNLPVEGDCKPNWIRECMLLDCDKEKINCLRRLRETTAMNPFYQYRIDRFVDAITQNYDPSGNDGMVPEVQD